MAARSLPFLLFCIANALDDNAQGGHSWPTFKNKQELEKDAWGKYYKILYGELPPHGYPISPKDLHMHYGNMLKKAGVTRIPAIVGDCPPASFIAFGSGGGDRYRTFVTHNLQPPGSVWVSHSWHGQAAHTWVEVIHDTGVDKQFAGDGAWMFWAPGSGTFVNIGKTAVYPEHYGAMMQWGCSGWDHTAGINCVAKKAAQAGYDSVQFTAWKDPMEYACCKMCAQGLEIVKVKWQGQEACMKAPSGGLRSGWKAARACHCDNRGTRLNCHGHHRLALNESDVIV